MMLVLWCGVWGGLQWVAGDGSIAGALAVSVSLSVSESICLPACPGSELGSLVGGCGSAIRRKRVSCAIAASKAAAGFGRVFCSRAAALYGW